MAASLDGYIAGPADEADWIVMDPELDFAGLWAQFDTMLMGRRTYEAAVARLGPAAITSLKTFVASRTMRREDHPKVTIIAELTKQWMQTLRRQAAKDIWLSGGGDLLGVLLRMDEIDTVEVTLMPVLLGSGVPLVSALAGRARLQLIEHKVFDSGIVSLKYSVQP